MSFSHLLLGTSAFLYGAAFLVDLLIFSGKKQEGGRTAQVLMRIGFLLGTFYFTAEAMNDSFIFPVYRFSQAMAFFAWSLAFVYLVLLSRIQSDSFGLILNPILLIFSGLALAAAVYCPVEAKPIHPSEVLKNPYFIIHIICAFFAYASFTLSFAAGILFLIQNRELKLRRAGTFYHKLPPLEVLEKLIAHPILWGAPLLLAAILIGVFWSKSVSNQYWVLDPKTIMTALVALLYLVILLLRNFSIVRGRQVAVLSLLAFGVMIAGFVGTRFIHGSHNELSAISDQTSASRQR